MAVTCTLIPGGKRFARATAGTVGAGADTIATGIPKEVIKAGENGSGFVVIGAVGYNITGWDPATNTLTTQNAGAPVTYSATSPLIIQYPSASER